MREVVALLSHDPCVIDDGSVGSDMGWNPNNDQQEQDAKNEGMRWETCVDRSLRCRFLELRQGVYIDMIEEKVDRAEEAISKTCKRSLLELKSYSLT